ncbi:Alpha/Beta hydrolase protein [Lactifluus volemus]|nr:Alpha/Beta hydrolase protein [Lactifluus volemus]
MPVSIVQDGTLCFSYEDSGALDGPYTTFVMVHGTGFHSGIFSPMIQFAAANRVRLILLNRRDYPGSTPFSDTELAELGSPDLETRAKALAQQGIDVGLFLAWLVREEKLPPVSTDRNGQQQGGIVLVAWSLAHTPLAGFLAHIDALPDDALRALEPCLRSYCIFDSPHGSFGLQTPSEYNPLVDSTYPMEQRVPRFYSWVSAYYTHSELARKTHDPALLDTTPPPYPPPPCAHPATLDVMAPASLEALSWPGPIQGSEALLHGMPLSLTFEQTRRMLFDEDLGSVLPRCKVILLWGENTLWEMEREAVGQVCRTLEIVEIPGANHFPHWDEPEAMIRFLNSVV